MAHPAFGDLEEESARRLLRILRDARARLMDALADGADRIGDKAPTEYDAVFAMRKKRAIEDAIADIRRQTGNALADTVGRASELAGIDLAEAAGFPIRVDPRVVAYAQATAGDRVIEWTNGFASKLRALTTDAAAGGLTYGEYVAGIRRTMGPAGAEHAVERIVRTELNRAYQQQRAAGDEVLASDGADLIRVWVSQLDIRVRDSHEAVHGQERELSDPFNVGRGATDETPPHGVGFQCNGPLDPVLPPEEAISCRCDVLYVPRAEATKRYIKKAIAAAVSASRRGPPDFRANIRARGWAWPLVDLRSEASMHRIGADYNPAQPRDGEGQWADGPGGIAIARPDAPAPAAAPAQPEQPKPAKRGLSPEEEASAEKRKKWAAEVPKSQRDAARAYSDDTWYEAVNGRLKKGEPMANARQQKIVDNLDAMIDGAPPWDTSRPLYRGISIPDSAVAGFKKSAAAGEVMQMKGFTSTSIKSSVAKEFATEFAPSPPPPRKAVLFKITTKKGAALYYNGLSKKDEAEVLLGRGWKYKVTNLVDAGASGLTVHLEAIHE